MDTQDKQNEQTQTEKPLARAAARLRGDGGRKHRSPRRRPRKQAVALRPGPAALDLRSQGAQALAAWRHDLIEHLGGQDSISVPERLLVERLVVTELLIQDADRTLLAMSTTVTANAYVALVKERQSLVDSQARLLDRLGLKAATKPAKSLDQVTREANARTAEREGRADVEVRGRVPGVRGQEPEPTARTRAERSDYDNVVAEPVEVRPASLVPDVQVPRVPEPEPLIDF